MSETKWKQRVNVPETGVMNIKTLISEEHVHKMCTKAFIHMHAWTKRPHTDAGTG